MSSLESERRSLALVILYPNRAEARDEVRRAIQYGSKFLSNGIMLTTQLVYLGKFSGLLRRIYKDINHPVIIYMKRHPEAPGVDSVHSRSSSRMVIFPISRTSSYSSVPSAPRLKLISTPDLKSLFSVDDVKLPPWSNGMCLAEYLPALEESLNLLVVESSASIGSRRRFIEALAPTFGSPIEADPIFCRRATVLSISGVFTFLVHFAIPLKFPKQQPVLTLQSSQHCNADGTPIMSSPINDYPWSPRWDQAEMVERIYDFLTDECQNFKKFCSDAIAQQK